MYYLGMSETQNTPQSFNPGMRVALHPVTTSWAMGARYGEVVKIGRKFVYVKLDLTDRIIRLHPANIEAI